MKLEDWYELVLWGINIPIPPEYEEIISIFRVVEDSRFLDYEITYITGISPYYVKILKKKYAKTTLQKQNGMMATHNLTLPEHEITGKNERKLNQREEKEKEVETEEVIVMWRGLKRYFDFDMNNPIDAEIVKRVKEYVENLKLDNSRNCTAAHKITYEEFFCRRILSKRLALGKHYWGRKLDEIIENKLLRWCKKKGLTRNEMVRQLFCVHFNIKTIEVK